MIRFTTCWFGFGRGWALRSVGVGLWVVMVLCFGRCGVLAGVREGLGVNVRGELLLNGKPFRGIGVNYYDLFVRTLAVREVSEASVGSGLKTLAKLNIPFVRFSAGGYWPQDWDLYRTNRAEHFRRMDAVVKEAERSGVGLIPSLFWMLSTVPDLVGEPVNRWGITNSATHGFMVNYTREVVRRYRHSKAIWGWEFGNEYNLAADLPNAAEHRPPVVVAMGTPARRSAEDELSHEAIRTAFGVFAREVRRWDKHRVVISGNAFPRASAWHQWKQRSWAKDTREQFEEVLGLDNPDPVNTLSVRAYDAKEDVGRLKWAMEVSKAVRKPLFVGEFGVPGAALAESRLAFAGMLAEIESLGVPLSALWVYDFEAQSRDWNVTLDNGRGWQLEEIQKANLRMRQQRPL